MHVCLCVCMWYVRHDAISHLIDYNIAYIELYQGLENQSIV